MASGTRLTQKTAEASLWLVPAVMHHAMVRGLSKILSYCSE